MPVAPKLSRPRPLIATSRARVWHGSAVGCVAALLLSGTPAHATGGSLSFGSAVDYQVSETYTPVSIASGDFNGDGRMDLVTANDITGGDEFAVILGHGDGTFEPATIYPTDTRPLSVAVGDFDEDGLSDAVLPSDSGNKVTVNFSNGDGTFDPMDLGMGMSPTSVVVGRFDDDSHQDVASTSSDSTLTVRLGDGHGSFGDLASYSTGASAFVRLGAADFNDDGRTDVAGVDGNSDTVRTMLANADGSFTAPKSTTLTSGFLVGLAVGNFNGDTFPDLVVAPAFGSAQSVLVGKGDGTFLEGASVDPGSEGRTAVGDFNHDGRQDLAISSFIGGLSIFLGNGDGTFQSRIPIPFGGDGQAVFAGDFNGDGYDDLALSDSDSVLVLINTTPLPSPPPSTLAPRPPTHGMASLRVPSRTVKVNLRTGKGSMRAICANVAPDKCVVRLVFKFLTAAKSHTARKRTIHIGRASGTITGGHVGTLKVKLNRKGLRLLRANRSHRLRGVSATGSSKNTAGQATAVRGGLTIRGVKPKKR